MVDVRLEVGVAYGGEAVAFLEIFPDRVVEAEAHPAGRGFRFHIVPCFGVPSASGLDSGVSDSEIVGGEAEVQKQGDRGVRVLRKIDQDIGAGAVGVVAETERDLLAHGRPSESEVLVDFVADFRLPGRPSAVLVLLHDAQDFGSALPVPLFRGGDGLSVLKCKEVGQCGLPVSGLAFVIVHGNSGYDIPVLGGGACGCEHAAGECCG